MLTENTIKLHKEILPFFNISYYWNGIPPIQSIQLENVTEQEFNHLTFSIKSNVPFIEDFTFEIASIAALKSTNIPLENLIINRDYLNKISENEKAILHIKLNSQTNNLINETIEIQIQILEQFGGFVVLPALIAAYITPNQSYIYHIKRQAIAILEKNTKLSSFIGYQSGDPEIVLQTMSAIYSAIQKEAIMYSSLAPGYEEVGQRLRLVPNIQKEKFANCIDISLLFAACLEAVDLNPILIIVRGHAFIGCWLKDEKFPESINEDKTAITKRIAKGIKEIAVVEATTLCKGNRNTFKESVFAAEAQLIEKEDFVLCVDVKRARTLGIKPIPLLDNAAQNQIDFGNLNIKLVTKFDKNFSIGTIYEDELLHGNLPMTKQKIWERKLLDLSLRNNLLNIRMTKNMLQIVDIDISLLEDNLADGKSFSILPNSNAELLKKYNLFIQPIHSNSYLFQIANDDLKDKKLHTYYHEQDLENILTHIHKNAKQAIEENGSSTLYLGVGLLKWYDSKTPEQPRFAPILLIPVEINRRSVNTKFTLKSREEETMINITLLEFLRQEYELNLSALEQLPYDEKGVDVAKVMGVLRRAILQLKGWDIEEQIVLGNFSFSKLILWKDIVEHQNELLKSELVKSLIDGKLSLNKIENQVNFENLDDINAQSIALPIATDVSQMEAILSAQHGNSFVLHGPPGTGKSQTITNIIADALFRGKRVLFVAAKKAALDVVHRRLEQIGLAPFTLELHSNKAKKSEVLAHLSKTLETTKHSTKANFEQEAIRLNNAKKAINIYVQLLHKKQKIGWSLYESIVAMENFKNVNFPKSSFSNFDFENVNATLWQQWIDLIPQINATIQNIIHPSENPLVLLNLPNYNPTIGDEIGSQIIKINQFLTSLNTSTENLAHALAFPFSITSKINWEQFVTLIKLFNSLPDISLNLFHLWADKEGAALYKEWSLNFRNYQKLNNQILIDYNKSVFDLNISLLENKWYKAQQAWFLPKWFHSRKIKKQINIYRKTSLKNNQEVIDLFENHKQYNDLKTLLNQNRFEDIKRNLKNLYKNELTEIDDIDLKASIVFQMSNIAILWEPNALKKWINIWQNNSFQNQYSDDIKLKNKELISDFLSQVENINEQLKMFKTIAGFEPASSENWISSTVTQLKTVLDHLVNLKYWISFKQVSKQANDLKLNWLIEDYYHKKFEKNQLNDYFNYTIHYTFCNIVISNNEDLSLFNKQLFESKIDQYKNIAKEFQQITIKELQSKLAAQLPNTSIDTSQNTEINILLRAIKNRGRAMSIRKIFDQIPSLLPKIAPCMLMSPISVAQYFDVDTKHFDLVIFDEASQLPTSEAVSSLARAKQSIIVGDPKQMPPTSFFSSNKIDEENMEVEDLESILDDCLSLSMPSKYLLRHYRSKHESLIAFSNAYYYENKLLTFPSSDDLNRKVKFHPIDGIYDKGKTRTNEKEATAIIAFIQSHYTNHASRKYSLGVVTFSQIQQNLIEEKLQVLFKENPNIEQLAIDNEEPLFIKNLENVQGDERDIILFSVAYANDESGKLSMNFGPLNREGGWRRLNVAITRARIEMHVFSSINSDQIDLIRTASEGVAGLKHFLKFAQYGNLDIPSNAVATVSNNHQLSNFIAKALENKGLTVKCNIGSSAFKIDIGIIHPEKPNEYILGILLDGEYYFNARTTNDRENVLPSVLKNLGWNIFRIWSMDWVENSTSILNEIVEKVNQIQQQSNNLESIDL